MRPRIYADFQKCDDDGRLKLTTRGTADDIKALGLTLTEGLQVTFYMDDANEAGDSDDLEVDGYVSYDHKRGYWVGVYDERGFRHASERK